MQYRKKGFKDRWWLGLGQMSASQDSASPEWHLSFLYMLSLLVFVFLYAHLYMPSFISSFLYISIIPCSLIVSLYFRFTEVSIALSSGGERGDLLLIVIPYTDSLYLQRSIAVSLNRETCNRRQCGTI